MEFMNWKPDWLEIARRQEEALCSGIPRQCDRQLLATSPAEFLGVEIPGIE